MLSVTRTLTVDRPQLDVYEYLMDFTHTEQWDPGTISTTRIDAGPLGVGARFHNVSEFRGRKTELDYELTNVEPGRRLIFTGNNKTVTSRDDLSFRAAAGSTEITYHATFDFHGLAALIAPLLKPALEKLGDRTVEQLSQVLTDTLAADTS